MKLGHAIIRKPDFRAAEGEVVERRPSYRAARHRMVELRRQDRSHSVYDVVLCQMPPKRKEVV